MTNAAAIALACLLIVALLVSVVVTFRVSYRRNRTMYARDKVSSAAIAFVSANFVPFTWIVWGLRAIDRKYWPPEPIGQYVGMSTGSGLDGEWLVGDVANGHMLGVDGNWRPLPPRRNSSPGRRRYWTAVGTVTFGLVSLLSAWAATDSEREDGPQLDDCVHRVGENDIATVSCDDARATHLVSSVHEGTSDGDVACADDLSATSYYYYTSTWNSIEMSSYLLCLTPANR